MNPPSGRTWGGDVRVDSLEVSLKLAGLLSAALADPALARARDLARPGPPRSTGWT